MINLPKEKYIINAICFGVIVLFCAPWILSSNTPYHKLILAFIWVPAFFHILLFSQRYQSIDYFGVYLYLFSAAWFSFVIIMHAQSADDLRDLKIPIYIGLTLLGFFAIAVADTDRLKKLLLFSAILGGCGAWFSIIMFYFVEGNSLLTRHLPIGLWGVIIPASQAAGVMLLLLVCLGFKENSRAPLNFCLIVSLSGYFAFLLSTQTRGVWISLFVVFFMLLFFWRNRKAYVLTVFFILALVVLYIFKQDLFLERGLSFRTELWGQGLMYALDNYLLGVGMGDRRIVIASTDVVFAHPHNMFIDIAIRFGFVGLLSWILLFGWAIAKAYRFRFTDLGRAAFVVLIYSIVVVLTDGIAQWKKPNFGWFVTWVPLALVFALGNAKEKLTAEVRATQAGED